MILIFLKISPSHYLTFYMYEELQVSVSYINNHSFPAIQQNTMSDLHQTGLLCAMTAPSRPRSYPICFLETIFVEVHR